DVYSKTRSWSQLLEDGGLATHPTGPHEQAMRLALGRLLHVDDTARIETYRAFAHSETPPTISELSLRELRLFHMLAATLTESVLSGDETLEDAANLL